MTLPSGNGQTDKAHSVSVVHAIDDSVFEKGGLTSATPGASNMFVVPVPAVSTPIDLSTADYANLLAAIVAGKKLSIRADYYLWYRWATATGTVDETATATNTPLNQAEALDMRERIRRVAPTTATWLIVKGASDTFLRITIVD